MPITLRDLIFLLLCFLIISCRPSAEHIPEPDHNPHLLKPGKQIEAQLQLIPRDSLPDPVYMPVKGRYIMAGKPEHIPSQQNFHPAGKAKYTPTQGAVIKTDSNFSLQFVPAEMKRVYSQWPKWQATRSPDKVDGAYPLYYLGVEHGLNYQTVRCQVEDHSGRIWIGTDNGLSVWDGAGFVHFTTQNGLIDNAVWSLFEDKQQNIWIGTKTGVMIWDGNGFLSFQADAAPTGFIYCFAQDRQGDIWIGSGSSVHGELSVWIWNGQGFFRFPKISNFFGLQLVYSILEDLQGDIWLSGYGTYKWDGKKLTKFSVQEGFGSDFIRCSIQDRSGKVWIGSFAGGVNVWDGKSITNYTNSQGLSNNTVWSLEEDRKGNLWMGTIGGGVSVWNGKGFMHYTQTEKISSNVVRSIVEDRFERLWLGTDQGGVIIWDNSAISGFLQMDGSSIGRVSSLLEDHLGRLWIGTLNSGLFIWDGKEFLHYSKDQGLLSNRVLALAEDHKGRIWIGTEGLSCFDGDGFTHYLPEHLQGNIVNALAVDGSGDIWAGTDLGLNIFQKDGFLHYDQVLLGKMQLVPHFGLNFLLDHEGKVWMGTMHGAGYLNEKGFVYIDLPEDVDPQWIPCLEEDRSGNLWIGTLEAGIWVWDGKLLSHYSKEQGLSFNSISAFFADKTGDVWVGTYGGGGLTRIREEQGSLIVDNMANIHRQQGASYYDIIKLSGKKELWLATDRGLEVMPLTLDTFIPTVLLREIQPFFDVIDWRQLEDTLTKGGAPRTGTAQIPLSRVAYDSVYRFTNLPADPAFPYNINQLSLHWNGLNAADPTKLQYSYLLRGRDRAWSPVVKADNVTFQDLRPGRYIFKIRAVGSTGRWSETVAYSFSIRAPWFWAWWSKTSYALLFFGGIWSVYRYRVAQIKRNFRLQQQTQTSEMKALRAQMNPHFLFNSLNSIKAAIMRRDSEKAGEALTTFADLMRQMLDNSSQETIPLNTEIEFLKTYLQVESLRLGNRLQWDLQVDKDIDTFDTAVPSMILQPFLENAIWHGISPRPDGGRVEVSMQRENGTLLCTIEDNGIGREAAAKIREERIGKRESRGEKITLERLALYDQKHKTTSTCEIVDLKSSREEALGTRIILKIGLRP